MAANPFCPPRCHSGEGRNPRLQGCTPAWMQVVEPRLEQAAEVIEPRQEQAAEEGGPECEGMAGFAGCPRLVIVPV